MTIDSFRGKYAFLSNFSKSPVYLHGGSLYCPTVEHAFQACKTTDMAQRRQIANAQTPGQAKRLGRQVALRVGWDSMRDDVMLELLRQKFAPDSTLADLLLATGDAVLIEGNTWGDRYWGVCNGKGENRLGELLMQVRDELQRAKRSNGPCRGARM